MAEIHMIDIILVLLIIAAVGLAVRKVIRNRKKGGCSCGCAGCSSGSCAERKQPGEISKSS